MFTNKRPYQCRWGLISTGFIVGAFSSDLLIDPKTREVDDIEHKIVAVASRDLAKSQTFIKEHLKGDKAVKPYSSYEALYADPNVDAVYIATPHAMHYACTKDALNAGKNVLLEKPATVNAEQFKRLTELAKAKDCFLMEAVWTRFFPLVKAYKELLAEGAIGDVQHVSAEMCMRRTIYGSDPHAVEGGIPHLRFVDPRLCGGSMMDAMLYPLTHLRMTVPHPFGVSPPTEGALPLPQISSVVVKARPSLTEPFGGGDVDEAAYATLLFPSGREDGSPHVVAQMHSSLMHNTPEERCVVISGNKGRITIAWPPFRPESFLLETWQSEADYLDRKPPNRSEERKFDFSGGIRGFAWEADEVARCIRDRKVESEVMSWRESVWQLSVLDTIRRQNDYTFPASIEAL